MSNARHWYVSPCLDVAEVAQKGRGEPPSCASAAVGHRDVGHQLVIVTALASEVRALNIGGPPRAWRAYETKVLYCTPPYKIYLYAL